MDPAEVNDRGFASDSGEVAVVTIMEWLRPALRRAAGL